MAQAIIYADFNNTDPQRRLRLTCQGTRDDLRTNNVELKDGLVLSLSDGELQAEGTVVFSQEGIWVAEIDWKRVSPA